MQRAFHSGQLINSLSVPSGNVPLKIVRNASARRYLLRLNPDASAQLTIPRHGSMAEGLRFAERNLGWLDRALQRLARRPTLPKEWRLGTEVHWRGALARIEAKSDRSGWVRVGGECIPVRDIAADLRADIERHFWKQAWEELPPVVHHYALRHEVRVTRVTIRNQRSRWGSCSQRGTISLNWRLVQTPLNVRDYLVLHELMHLREMNHSERFWNHVEQVCPEYRIAEVWLNKHSHLLR